MWRRRCPTRWWRCSGTSRRPAARPHGAPRAANCGPWSPPRAPPALQGSCWWPPGRPRGTVPARPGGGCPPRSAPRPSLRPAAPAAASARGAGGGLWDGGVRDAAGSNRTQRLSTHSAPGMGAGLDLMERSGAAAVRQWMGAGAANAAQSSIRIPCIHPHPLHILQWMGSGAVSAT